jgi:polyhydroxyalkanoate synthesis regulator protein
VCAKRYARQQLYRSATGTYLTRGDLMTMENNGDRIRRDRRRHRK